MLCLCLVENDANKELRAEIVELRAQLIEDSSHDVQRLTSSLEELEEKYAKLQAEMQNQKVRADGL